MNILKKIVATLIVVGLLGQTGINSFASEQSFNNSNEVKILVLKGDIYREIKGGEKIIKKIDSLMPQMSATQTRKLSSQISILKSKVSSKSIGVGSKEEKMLLLMDYIQLKIEEKESPVAPTISVDTTFSQTLSSEDNKKVNTELVKIQKNILKHGTVYIENIIGEFEKYANYQEKGDFKARIDVDHEMVGKIKAKLELNDYEVNNSKFDAQLKTKMKAVIDAAPKGDEALKLEISGLLDFISKDQNYYLLIKELNIVNDGSIKEITEFSQAMKDIAASNKYIQFKDENTAQVMEVLKTFSPKNILSEGNEIVSKPLFKAYKKKGERFYLVPTLYACNTAKKLAQKFDPFNGDTCTQGQYDDMLEDLAESKIDFYIELGESTTIGFDAKMVDDDLEAFNGDIVFSSDHIEKLNFTIMPNQTQYPNEGAEMTYKRNASLNGYIYAESGDVDIKMTSTLDANNSFKTIYLSMKADELNGTLSLKNKKIIGNYSAISSTEKLTGRISGKMDDAGKLGELRVTNEMSNTGTYSPFENTSRFEYKKGQMVFANVYTSEGTKSNLDIGASWNPSKQELVAGNLSLDIYTKESNYDYETNKTVYSGDFIRIFETDMELQNKGIDGETIIRGNDGVLLKIDHSGKLEKNYFQLSNKFSGGIYQYVTGQQGNSDGNVNIELDQRNNKNNGNIFIDINLNLNKILELEIDNSSQRVYKDIDIIAPSNTVQLEEVITNPKY